VKFQCSESAKNHPKRKDDGLSWEAALNASDIEGGGGLEGKLSVGRHVRKREKIKTLLRGFPKKGSEQRRGQNWVGKIGEVGFLLATPKGPFRLGIGK